MSADGGTDPSQYAISLNAEELASINEFLQKHPDQLLQIPQIRHLISASRIQRLKSGDIRTIDGPCENSIQNVVQYNLQGVAGMWALGRPSILINPLMSCGYVATKAPNLKLLTVGPRTEAEIFALLAAGFSPANIRGLDLISYSPFIDIGDMHDMPYEDNSFDVIILGWVLAYSTNNRRAVDEVLRVARPGAYIAVGCEYNPLTNEEITKELEAVMPHSTGDDTTRYDTTEDITRLFEGHIDTILFRHDVHPSMRHEAGGLMVIFQIKE